MIIEMLINNNSFDLELKANKATELLIEKLHHSDIQLEAHDNGGFEKVGNMGFSLPTNDTYISTKNGDVMLYCGNQLVVFYKNHGWSYTPIGHIINQQDLEKIKDDSYVTIVLKLKDK